MSSLAAFPWMLTGGGVMALAGALLLRLAAVRQARAAAEAGLRALEAGDAVVRSLQPIVAEGEPLLQTASIRPVSPELIAALGGFRRRAEEVLRQAKGEPPPEAALGQLGLDANELFDAAELTVRAVIRLHAGAASDEPQELMHGEARHASARLSELAAKLADARTRITAERRTLEARLGRPALPFAPRIGWRPQASK